VRIGFVSCVQLGLDCIEELVRADANLVYLGTLSDELARDKSGRVYLDEIAKELGLPLQKFRNINDPEAVASIRSAEVDWLYIVGWSQVARREVLETPGLGVIGIHPTLLPVGRGRASVPWAIIKGLAETGVTMFQLDEGVDTGPIIGQVRIPLEKRETASTLYRKVIGAHRELIGRFHPPLEAGTLIPTPQDESQATEWPKRRPKEGELVPSRLTADEVDRMVRALTHPYPGAFIRMPDGRLLRIWAGTLHAGGSAIRIDAKDAPYFATDYDWDS
jgi:methionyl-tRNA formyltransferase